MKMRVLTLAVAASAMFLSGCVNPDGSPNNTGSGALIGGGLGALTGAAIGGCAHGGPDALIGAAVGAVAGGLIGNSADREQNARLQAMAPPPTYVRVEPGRPLTVSDVKALARAGISEDIIISQIQNSHTIYHLTAADIIDLRNAGVGDRVVRFMIGTPGMMTMSTAAYPGTATYVR